MNHTYYTVYLGASQLTRDPGPRNIESHGGRQFIHIYIIFRGFIYTYGKANAAKEMDPNDSMQMRNSATGQRLGQKSGR